MSRHAIRHLLESLNRVHRNSFALNLLRGYKRNVYHRASWDCLSGVKEGAQFVVFPDGSGVLMSASKLFEAFVE